MLDYILYALLGLSVLLLIGCAFLFLNIWLLKKSHVKTIKKMEETHKQWFAELQRANAAGVAQPTDGVEQTKTERVTQAR